MPPVLLCNISDVVAVINEEKAQWVSRILEILGVPEEVLKISDIDEYRNRIL